MNHEHEAADVYIKMADDGNEDSNISGFMNKRGRRSLKWKPVFAKIESNCLVYGQSEDVCNVKMGLVS